MPPAGGKSFPSINPATEKKLCDVALGTAADVDAACRAAQDFADPIHPSAQGSRKIAERVAQWVELEHARA